jgi:hypothetical protein
MTRTRFTEGQIASVLKEAGAGAKTGPCRVAWRVCSARLGLLKRRFKTGGPIGVLEVPQPRRLRELESENAYLNGLWQIRC